MSIAAAIVVAMAQPVSSSTLRNASPGLLAAPLSCRVISSMKSCRAVGKEWRGLPASPACHPYPSPLNFIANVFQVERHG